MNPVTDREVEEKFRTLTKNTTTKEHVDQFLKKSWRLEEARDVSDVLATLIKA